jgi:hypothetical protein
LRILRLRGSAYEMGYQHGTLLSQEIRSALKEQVYDGLVTEDGLSHLLLLRFARHMEAYIPSEYREEMRGLADGAGLSYSDVLVLHTFRELLSQPWPGSVTRELVLEFSPPFLPPFPLYQPSMSAGSVAENEALDILSLPLESAFAAFGEATSDGKLLQGVDLADTVGRAEDLLLIVYAPDNGNSFVSLGWPGAVGVTVGLNEEKIAVAELAVPSRDASVEGTPLSFLLRDVLQYAGDIPTALRLLSSAPRTSGHSVIIGDGKPPDAQALELSAHLNAVFEAQQGVVVRSNQYLDAALAETQGVYAGEEYARSQERLNGVSEALDAARGRLDLPGAVNIVRDAHTDDSPSSGSLLGAVIAASDLQMCVCTEESAAPLCFSLGEEP